MIRDLHCAARVIPRCISIFTASALRSIPTLALSAAIARGTSDSQGAVDAYRFPEPIRTGHHTSGSNHRAKPSADAQLESGESPHEAVAEVPCAVKVRAASAEHVPSQR